MFGGRTGPGDTVTDEELAALVGYEFAGGTYRIGHWENWLLTDCTGFDQLPNAAVHPIALFHVPILGSGTSITELFSLVGARGPGSVSLLGYDWEYLQPLYEDVAYRGEGSIVDATRFADADGKVADTITFRFELFDAHDGLVARVTNRWRLNRWVQSGDGR